MNKKYAMIIDGDNMMSCSLPYPMSCPNCHNDYWIISGVDDLVKLSQKCKCKDQMPKDNKKSAKDFEYDDDDYEDRADTNEPIDPDNMIKPDEYF